MPPIDRIGIAHDSSGANQSIGNRKMRFAETAPDFSQVIAATGRHATQGPLIETGSDRLKPESAAVIQTIAGGMRADPKLRLLIHGHTDSAGGAASNMDRSKRRALAVRSISAQQFQADATRLAMADPGSGSPHDWNGPPEAAHKTAAWNRIASRRG